MEWFHEDSERCKPMHVRHSLDALHVAQPTISRYSSDSALEVFVVSSGRMPLVRDVTEPPRWITSRTLAL